MQLGKTQDFASPEEALKHHGVKGMKWGVHKKEDTSGDSGSSDFFIPPQATAQRNVIEKGQFPSSQQRYERITRTDHPQVLQPQSFTKPPRTHGLSRNEKIALGIGAAGLATAGYVAYRHYAGSTMPGLDLNKLHQEQQTVESSLGRLTLPSKWDVQGLKNGPISTTKMGELAGGETEVQLRNIDNLVINTSRGYADILPKDGFTNPFAAEQHASVTRVLEEMRDKYPAIRNLNVEVVPMSATGNGQEQNAFMSVMAMRAGEARIVYNDLMDAPNAAMIRANRRFLPGLGKKDYVAYHEMGHLLAVAHGDLPPAYDLVGRNYDIREWRTWQKAEPLLHRRTMANHGFTFKELSKLSQYAATQPAEAVAELVGHYFQPDMRKTLTPDQIQRAESMINEMGGLT